MEKKAIIIFLTLIQLSVILTTDKTTTIFNAGDSIAAERDTNNDNPERGLGQMLQNYFNKNFVEVQNHARGGRSSKSFIGEGHWVKSYKNEKR